MQNSNKLINAYVIILIMWLCLTIIGIIIFIKNIDKFQVKEIIVKSEDETNEVVEEQPITKEQPLIENTKGANYTARLTSFYANDGYGTGSCTGTGLCEKDFQVNENGWYTYGGKLVLATGTPYLLYYGYERKEGIRLYDYLQELTVIIDGISYQAIVLDSCGACMGDNRIDLFVSNSESVKDTIVEVVK